MDCRGNELWPLDPGRPPRSVPPMTRWSAPCRPGAAAPSDRSGFRCRPRSLNRRARVHPDSGSQRATAPTTHAHYREDPGLLYLINEQTLLFGGLHLCQSVSRVVWSRSAGAADRVDLVAPAAGVGRWRCAVRKSQAATTRAAADGRSATVNPWLGVNEINVGPSTALFTRVHPNARTASTAPTRYRLRLLMLRQRTGHLFRPQCERPAHATAGSVGRCPSTRSRSGVRPRMSLIIRSYSGRQTPLLLALRSLSR